MLKNVHFVNKKSSVLHSVKKNNNSKLDKILNIKYPMKMNEVSKIHNKIHIVKN